MGGVSSEAGQVVTLSRHTALSRGAGPKRRTALARTGIRSSAAVKAADISGSGGSACGNLSSPDPLHRRTALARGRKPLPAASRKTIAARPEKDRVRAEVFDRDGRCRLLGRGYSACYGPPTVHHLRKASDNGDYSTTNLICLCAHHNGEVECFPAWAVELGLAERGRQTPEETWRRLFLARLAASPEVGSGPVAW